MAKTTLACESYYFNEEHIRTFVQRVS